MHQFVITRRTIYEFPNRTHVSVFEFSGLSDEKECVLFLFIFFLLVYMVTIVGNLGIIALVFAFSSLHTPMYFFLSSLSLVDLFYSSVITPNTLNNLFSFRKSISFFGCALQLYFFSALASTETLLLSTMSYDRYVAICHPLHYTLIMTKKKCFGLILLCYSLCFMQSFVHTCCVFSLPFCGPNLIDHFYCDIPPLLKLSCSSPFHCTMVTGILVVACGIYTFIAISLSYAFIFLSIFRMTSSNGRRKAFSTCSSHIICVSTFFTTVFFVYLRPHSGVFRIQDKMASVFYTTVTPMLNPLIYSLRNQEVKQILIQVIRRSLNRTPP
ncbi:olfactory receptor 5G26-like [Pyxicephalus adspersus]|uniref:olfactory receptor 5G26-like n=1 Tax=Pyxicephalus adspersus TaxID=30357 RepID=UPI003B5C9A15